jgi:hypothetical protein
MRTKNKQNLRLFARLVFTSLLDHPLAGKQVAEGSGILFDSMILFRFCDCPMIWLVIC